MQLRLQQAEHVRGQRVLVGHDAVEADLRPVGIAIRDLVPCIMTKRVSPAGPAANTYLQLVPEMLGHKANL